MTTLRNTAFALLLLIQAGTYLAGPADNITPFCDICSCHNQTATRPEVNCADKLVTYTLYDQQNWYNNATNQTYSMASLNLQFVNLRDLNHTFPASNLATLDLSNNNIYNIQDEVFKNLQDMVELILSDNEIQNIGVNAFKGLRLDGYDYPLRAIKILRLDRNKIHTLHPDVFQHIEMELEVLTLSGNPLTLIDQKTVIAIGSIIHLKELDLSHTLLKKLPDHIFHPPKELAKLDLSGNLFEVVPQALVDTHSLRELYFNNNPIVNLTKKIGFPIIPTLKLLHMCHMPKLVEIGARSLSGLENLEELHLSNNIALTSVHSQALSRKDVENEIWPPINKIHIRNNKMTHLNSTIILKWDGLSALDVRENPWTCECENQWLVDELMPSYLRINETQAKSVTCAAPVEMEGQTLYDIYAKKSKMRCLDVFGNRPERDGTILVGVLIGVLIGIPLVLFVLYSYQRNWYGLFDKSPAAYSRQFYSQTSTDDGGL